MCIIFILIVILHKLIVFYFRLSGFPATTGLITCIQTHTLFVPHTQTVKTCIYTHTNTHTQYSSLDAEDDCVCIKCRATFAFLCFSNQDDTRPALWGTHKYTQAHEGTEFVPACSCVWENESYQTPTYFWINGFVNVTLNPEVKDRLHHTH